MNGIDMRDDIPHIHLPNVRLRLIEIETHTGTGTQEFRSLIDFAENKFLLELESMELQLALHAFGKLGCCLLYEYLTSYIFACLCDKLHYRFVDYLYTIDERQSMLF
jgi:hypothetical protein